MIAVPNAIPAKEKRVDNKKETAIPFVGEKTQHLCIKKLIPIPVEALNILAKAGDIILTNMLYTIKSVNVATTDDVRNLAIFNIFR